VLEDAIVRIKRNALEKKRIRVLAGMSAISTGSVDDMLAISEMMAEKKSIDEELAKLKDTNE